MRNTLLHCLSSAIAILGTTFALHVQAAPPSTESIEQLLIVTKAQASIEAVYANTEHMMRQSMLNAQNGKPITPEMQRVLDTLPGKLVASLRESMSWEILKPMMMRVYQETYDQEEVNGLLSFYYSPAGQAFVNKTPLLAQKIMVLTQSMMQAMLPKLSAAAAQAMAQAKGTQ